MEILVLLIPLSIILVGVAAWAFIWAVNHRQFDDLDKHAMDILSDDTTFDDAIFDDPGSNEK